MSEASVLSNCSFIKVLKVSKIHKYIENNVTRICPLPSLRNKALPLQLTPFVYTSALRFSLFHCSPDFDLDLSHVYLYTFTIYVSIPKLYVVLYLNSITLCVPSAICFPHSLLCLGDLSLLIIYI